MALEVAVGEVLGQGISAHVLGADVADVDGAALLLLARVVVGKVDVLRSRALHRVAGHGDAALAVAEEIDRALRTWCSRSRCRISPTIWLL